MIIYYIICICLALLLLLAYPLSEFLKVVEDEEVCKKCESRDECFAMKRGSLTNKDVTILEQLMLLSFVAIRDKCPAIKDIPSSKKNSIIAYICGIFLSLILFWSKGSDFEGMLFAIATVALLFLAIVDFRTQFIPLEMSGIIFICGLIHLFNDFSNWDEYVIGLIAVSGFLFIVNKLATPVLRKKYQDDGIDNVIGDGDIKLMAATGLLIGWKLNFLALAFGCILGSIIHIVLMKIKKGERIFAFGPYLSLGVYIAILCGEQLISWYLNLLVATPPGL